MDKVYLPGTIIENRYPGEPLRDQKRFSTSQEISKGKYHPPTINDNSFPYEKIADILKR